MEQLTFLPNLLPGEHLLGAFSRLLLLNAGGSSAEMQKSIIGNVSSLNVSLIYHKSYDLLFDLFIKQKTKEALLNQHTMLGFYRHSMKYQQRKKVLSNDSSEGLSKLAFPGGKLMKHAQHWRWCQSCVKENEQKYGVAYWHTAHQLPTAITCHEHKGEQLVFSCCHCGFKVYDLKKCQVPPSTSCPACKVGFETIYRDLGEDAKWIQQAGVELLNNTSSFLRPEFEYVMQWVIDLVTSRQWKLRSHNIESVLEMKQTLFTDWLVERGLDELFISGTELNTCKALSIGKTIEFPRKVPAISHLLWLRFLGIQSLKDAKRNGYVRPLVTE